MTPEEIAALVAQSVAAALGQAATEQEKPAAKPRSRTSEAKAKVADTAAKPDTIVRKLDTIPLTAEDGTVMARIVPAGKTVGPFTNGARIYGAKSTTLTIEQLRWLAERIDSVETLVDKVDRDGKLGKYAPTKPAATATAAPDGNAVVLA